MIDENESTELVTTSLDKNTNELVTQIIDENDLTKVKDIIQLFNVNIAKKNMIRLLKLSNLLENVNEEAMRRIEFYSDTIKDKDLLGYMTAIQTSIEKSGKFLEQITNSALPIMQLTQQNNEININVGDNNQLDKESKQRVLAAIEALLATSNTQEEQLQNDYIEIKDGDIDD